MIQVACQGHQPHTGRHRVAFAALLEPSCGSSTPRALAEAPRAELSGCAWPLRDQPAAHERPPASMGHPDVSCEAVTAHFPKALGHKKDLDRVETPLERPKERAFW